jgi:ribosomal protein S18 acetylase RimI-like enzyme
MNEITIKRIEEEDGPFLSKLALKAYADHYLHLWDDGGDWYTNKYFSTEKLLDEVKDKNSLFFVAYLNNDPVGFLKININAPFEGLEEKNALELERIYLVKKATGQGVGKALVGHTFTIANKYNKNLIWLKAMDTSDGAIAFYKKMDFRIAGVHRLKHPLMKEELRGMVIMVKELGEQQK